MTKGLNKMILIFVVIILLATVMTRSNIIDCDTIEEISQQDLIAIQEIFKEELYIMARSSSFQAIIKGSTIMNMLFLQNASYIESFVEAQPLLTLLEEHKHDVMEVAKVISDAFFQDIYSKTVRVYSMANTIPHIICVYKFFESIQAHHVIVDYLQNTTAFCDGNSPIITPQTYDRIEASRIYKNILEKTWPGFQLTMEGDSHNFSISFGYHHKNLPFIVTCVYAEFDIPQNLYETLKDTVKFYCGR